MTFSYSGNPSSSDRDQVRFLIADTNSAAPILQDEEIDYLLATETSVARAALAAAEEVLSRFARQVDKTVGPTQISASQRHAQYKDTVARLRKNLRKGAMPYAGGISVSDKQSGEADPDRVQPAFSRNLHSYPENAATGNAGNKEVVY